MKVGISTACFSLKQETETAVKTIKSLGADCMEVCLQTFYEYRPEFAKAVTPDICGVNAHSVRTFSDNFEGQLFNPSRRIRGDGFYWLDQVMRSAQLLGAKNYTFRGFTRKAPANDDFDDLSAYIRGVTEFCSRYGVNLCLKNDSLGLYNRPSVFGKLKARCPELSGVFDIKEARRSGYPYTMYLKDMAGAISHVHLSDADVNGNICLPANGTLDFNEIIKQLKDVGFDGNIFIDVCPECYGNVEEIRQSLDYLNGIIYKMN